MKIRIFMVALLLQLTGLNLAFAETQTQDNIIGKKLAIDSKVLAESRDIQIYLPDSYQTSDKRYPVLYILDGQRLFLHGVSVNQSFTSQFDLSPDFIVVGINNRYPQRFGNFLGSKFLDFIEHELVTHIDKTYRTTAERLIFGWEYAGAFAIESMITRPHLFDGHITASPYPLNVAGEGQKTRVERLGEKLNNKFSSFLYFAVGNNEQGVVEGTNELHDLLKSKPDTKLNWHFRGLEGEQHTSTPYTSLYQGLRKYFYYYPQLAIYTLTEYEALGGMDYVYSYNKTRAKQFGFKDELAFWSMFALVRAAMRADNFEKFEFFMQTFADHGFVAKAQLRRVFSVGDFYLKNNKPTAAIAFYQQLLVKNADSARLHAAIGDIYLTQKDGKKAVEHFQQAVTLAKAQKDDKLAAYQANLAKALSAK